MAELQFGAGASSSSTHRLTQSSSTLNRRYVERPSNLVIEEAARSRSSARSVATPAPSRLVNLRVHAADLQQIEAAPAPEPSKPTQPIVPKVVELGGNSTDFSQIVPEEAPIDNSISYAPVPYSAPVADTATYNNMSQTNNYYTETTTYNNSEYNNTAYTDSYSNSALAPTNNYYPESTPATVDTSDTQALAMSIAADYAAANLGASMSSPATTNDLSSAISNSSIDTIASAASQAIAAIRTATDPEEIAEQVASLQTFADNIKANSTAPEMLELSDTIEKFVKVAMKSSRVQEEVEKRNQPKNALEESDLKLKVAAKKSPAKPAAKVARKVTTAKPVATTSARRFARPTVKSPAKTIAKSTRPASKPLVRRTPKVSSTIGVDEEQALRKALRSVAAIDDDTTDKPGKKRTVRRKGSGKRFALAFFCAIICVGAIVYFVGSSIPDISVKVAAMQTGIEASYPSYVPREFSLSDINSEEGKITMTFNGPDKTSFTLSEEKSSWDSTTLLRNFVETTWNNNYVTTHEQGITIYISGANAAWVNGGVLYKIEAASNALTKKQLRNIVVSL